MADQRVHYMPLANAATQAFIDANVDEANRTGDLQTDFRKALVAVIDSVEDENKLTLDDLWKLYVINVVSGDSNAAAGNPASEGLGSGGEGHVGQAPGQYYTEEFLDDKDGSRAGGGPGFPGGSQGFGGFENFTLTSDNGEWNVVDAASGFRWNDDGTRGYICTDDGLVHRIFKGAVESTTPYELLGQDYLNDDTVFDGGDRIRDFAWNEDGTGIFAVDYDAARIKEYNGTAGAAYNLTDINNTSVASFATHTQPLAIDISADGTKFYTVNNSSGAIHQYGASVAWDISTLSLDGTVTPTWPDGGGSPKANAFRMSSDGKSFIMTNQSDSTISRWTLDGDPFDLTGGVSLDTSLSVYSPSNYLNALDVNPSNTKLTVIDDDTSGGKIYNFGKDASAFESEVKFEAGSVVHASYSISVDGRTLSKSSSNQWRIAMANKQFYQGKWYFEVEVLTAPENLLMVGIANDTQTLTDFLGRNGYSWGWQSDAVAGIIRHNNGQVNVPALAGASTNGDIMMVAWDHAEQKLWYGLNGTWDGDPAAGTGSRYVNMDVPVRPAVATYQNQTNICRANFASGDMTYTPPTGFSPVSPV